MRVSKYAIPAEPMLCHYAKPCVYREDETCQEPRINKGNGDAACHKMNNKDLLTLLTRPLMDERSKAMKKMMDVMPFAKQKP